MSLVALLFFAVAISVAELGRLRSDAREIVDAGKRGNDLAAMMMSGLQKQNSAILPTASTTRARRSLRMPTPRLWR